MIYGKAGCGMQYAVRKSGSAVAYCALSIHCGTRDEKGFHSGIAHFTEHTIFKGTKGKSASVINNYLDRLGGELNAFTTKEEIVLHATEAVKVGVDARCAEMLGALEDGMLDEVRRALRKFAFRPGAAAYAERAICHLAGCALHRETESALTSSASHPCIRVPC